MIKVLGIGSPFGDDRAGWETIEQLKQQKALVPFISRGLQLTCHDRPGMHLLSLLEGATAVYLIDAVKTGAAMPGSIHRYEGQAIQKASSSTLSSHDIGVLEALELGFVLNLLPKTVVVYGIEIGEIDCCSAACSSVVRDAAHEVSDQIMNELRIQLR